MTSSSACARALAACLLCLLCLLSPLSLRCGAAPAEAEAPAWQLYFANDTLTGRVAPCSAAQQFCLRAGLLLFEPDGKCYLFADRGPCAWDESVRVDKAELARSGRVRAACVSKDLCGPGKFKMSRDGACLGFRELQDICYVQPGVIRTEDVFGETVCDCGSANEECPVKKEAVQIPDQDQVGAGQCAVPDVRATRLPRLPYSLRASARARVPCSEEERRCFLDGRVLVPKRGLCFELARRGPCAPGHWLLLDREEAVNGSGRLVGACRERKCAEGLVRRAEGGACVQPEALCGAYGVVFDWEGGAACGEPYYTLTLPTVRGEEGQCRYAGPDTEPPPPPHYPAGPPPPAPPACPNATAGYCDRPAASRPAPSSPAA